VQAEAGVTLEMLPSSCDYITAREKARMAVKI